MFCSSVLNQKRPLQPQPEEQRRGNGGARARSPDADGAAAEEEEGLPRSLAPPPPPSSFRFLWLLAVAGCSQGAPLGQESLDMARSPQMLQITYAYIYRHFAIQYLVSNY